MKSRAIGIIVAVVVSVCQQAAWAQSPSDFTFKRVKPPSAGTKRLITIQVEPVAAVAAVLTNTPNVPTVPVAPTRRGVDAGQTATWFWTQMSPALQDAGFGKLRAAMQVLASNSTKSDGLYPAPARVEQVASTYGEYILKATAGTQVSPALVVSVIAVESAGQPRAESSAGAVGLMQLMPATAKRFGVTDRTDPAQNISGGVKYLDFLLTEFGGDALLALAGYNAGEGAVQRAAGVPDYKETRAYVPKVVAAWAQSRLLCLSPPDRATDGCLFTGAKVARQ